MSYGLSIGLSILETKILVLLFTILPIDCLSYFIFLPMFIQQPIDINLFLLINGWDNNFLTIGTYR